MSSESQVDTNTNDKKNLKKMIKTKKTDVVDKVNKKEEVVEVKKDEVKAKEKVSKKNKTDTVVDEPVVESDKKVKKNKKTEVKTESVDVPVEEKKVRKSKSKEKVFPVMNDTISFEYNPHKVDKYSKTCVNNIDSMLKTVIDFYDKDNIYYKDVLKKISEGLSRSSDLKLKKKKSKKEGEPPKAKSSYMIYLAENRNKIKDELSKDKPAAFEDITREVGRRWKQLSASEKEYYESKNKEDKKRYEEELKKFNESSAQEAS